MWNWFTDARHRRLTFWLAVLLILAGGGFALFHWLFGGLPSLDTLPSHLLDPSVRIVDRKGRLLYDILPQGGGRHTVVPLSSIALSLLQATIATEDSHFYTNPGVDFIGILRAFWINLIGGHTISGGSTITQQVARNLLLTDEERLQQTYLRKLREVYLAWQLTRHYSKDQILALYLNQSNYGGLSYGVEAAAQTFFGKPASELDLAESALLAGLPQAPSLYNPYTDMDAGRKRQAVVLGLMEQAGYISADERSLAANEPLVLAATPYPMEAPHFVMMVRSQLDALLGQFPPGIDLLGGLTVRTTLDLDWQHIAESAITRQLTKLSQQEGGLGHNLNSAALIAIDPRSGEILTMVGSPDYFNKANAGAINMTLSPRQPGSALKPIVYAAVLSPNQAKPWTAATSILDVSTSFVTHEGQSYIPANYDQKEHGPVSLRVALASSLNIPAVITLDHLGLPAFFEFAARFGLDTFGNPDDYDLSLALGGGAVRLIDLTSAYGSFADHGLHVEPFAILDITNSHGQVIYTAPTPQPIQVVDERVAWLISDILSDNNARTLGFGRNSVLQLDRPAAVKTGTTSNFHDNWTVGYTPSLVVGVWAGNTDYQPMRNVSGVTGAAPIWHQFMREVLTGLPEETFQRPDNLVQVEVCTLSGLLPTPACPYRHLEWFLPGTQPSTTDTYYKEVIIDTATGQPAAPSTPAERRITRIFLDLPPRAQPWARENNLPLFSSLQVNGNPSNPTQGNNALSTAAPLQVVSPAKQSIYRIAPGYSTESQQILIEAVGEAGLKQVTLWLDDVQIAAFTASPYRTWWTLAPGKHHVWAEAQRSTGEKITSPIITFEVK